MSSDAKTRTKASTTHCSSVGDAPSSAPEVGQRDRDDRRRGDVDELGRRDRREDAPRPRAGRRHARTLRRAGAGYGARMEQRQLGASGLRVSALTLGTMTFGGKGNFANVGDTGVEGARRQIDLCLDAGVTLIDTADVYSDGASEEILGRALAGTARRGPAWPRRCASPWAPAPTTPGSRATTSSRAARPACGGWAPTTSTSTRCTSGTARRRSRRRSPRSSTCSTRARSATSGARTTPPGRWSRRSGSPTCAGCRASSARRSTTRCRSARSSTRSCPPAWTRASACSCGARWPAACSRASTAAGQEGPAGSRQLTDWGEPPVYDEDKLYDTIDVLVEVAEGHGVSAAQVALAWLLRRPGISTVIVGARTDEQLADNLRRGRPPARRRGAHAARRGQPAAAALPALAPGQDGERSLRAGRRRVLAPLPADDGPLHVRARPLRDHRAARRPGATATAPAASGGPATASSAQAAIDASSLRFLEGEELVRAYRPPDGFEKLFCSACGSALFSRSPDDPSRMSVRLGVLDARSGRAGVVAPARRVGRVLGADPRRRRAALPGAAHDTGLSGRGAPDRAGRHVHRGLRRAWRRAARSDQAVLVTSVAEYEAAFGAGGHLGAAVRGFFANGGQRVWVAPALAAPGRRATTSRSSPAPASPTRRS